MPGFTCCVNKSKTALHRAARLDFVFAIRLLSVATESADAVDARPITSKQRHIRLA
jgi:hypothetical protein